MSVRSNVPHYVYRYYDKGGRLLYIGCTNSPVMRRRGHELNSSWFSEVAHTRHTVFPDRRAALQREAAAIHAEKPRWNVKGRWRTGYSREHWDLEDYRAFMWAVIEAAHVVTNNTRKLIREIVAEAQDRFGVTLLRTAA